MQYEHVMFQRVGRVEVRPYFEFRHTNMQDRLKRKGQVKSLLASRPCPAR